MDIYTREDLIKRGWTVELEYLLKNKRQVKDNIEFWYKNSILNLEKKEDFQSNLFKKELNEYMQMGKDFVSALNIDFSTKKYLIGNMDKYNFFEPVYHLVKKDFKPEIDKASNYILFTDGAFKKVDNKEFSSCGGWIIDKNSKEVIVEFSKQLSLDTNQKRNMPKFEILAIEEGVRLIKELGLKNVECYTDSNTEARKLFLALKGIETPHYKANRALYEPILKILKNSGSSIAWLPREYNKHADELSKVCLNAHIEKNDGQYKQKDYIAEHGYKINTEEVIYFHQDKIKTINYKNLEHNLTIIVREYIIGKEQYIISLTHDKENHRLSIIEKKLLPREDHTNKKDGLILEQLCKILNDNNRTYGNLQNINICVPQLVTAVNDKVTPIPTNLQEVFFNFHEALNNYPHQLTMTNRWPKLNTKIKEYLDKNIEGNVSKKIKI